MYVLGHSGGIVRDPSLLLFIHTFLAQVAGAESAPDSYVWEILIWKWYEARYRGEIYP